MICGEFYVIECCENGKSSTVAEHPQHVYFWPPAICKLVVLYPLRRFNLYVDGVSIRVPSIAMMLMV